MGHASALRVLIVGCDAAARGALRDRLEHDGMVVCAEASDAGDARRLAVNEKPDLCLLADSPPLDGVAAARMISAAAPGVRVLLMGADASDSRLLAAVGAGAFGYLTDDPGSPRLTAALRDAAAGRPAFPRHLEALLISSLHDGDG